MTELTLLKLGGSLITDKDTPYTPRLDKLKELADEIASFWTSGRPLILGHGSGSFGHAAAKEYGTRDGIPTPAPLGASRHFPQMRSIWGKTEGGRYWKGFAEVWFQASQLNRFVMEALRAAGLPAIALAPVSAVTAHEIRVARWDLTPLRSALAAGLLPVIYGDVIFDEKRGGTILSTEDLFAHLTRELRPGRILLAGLEEGVWEDFPARTRLVSEIGFPSYEAMRAGIGASSSVDVTGGMAAKVGQMFELIQEVPGLTASIFSAEEAGNLSRALAGEAIGTALRA
ncbi:MAG: isopentenyl phosphate kinase family protein [Chloroflexi bacterium]|nr:isopentenyl phosphate kinase family protein [Chloroflexota bacterium]